MENQDFSHTLNQLKTIQVSLHQIKDYNDENYNKLQQLHKQLEPIESQYRDFRSKNFAKMAEDSNRVEMSSFPIAETTKAPDKITAYKNGWTFIDDIIGQMIQGLSVH